MIAGPNGSGKSTLIKHLQAQNIDVGIYINADDIAAGLTGSYDERVLMAQQMAKEQREKCVQSGLSFTFETVMSHSSKLEFFASAALKEFITVLYFISTSDPGVNVERVNQRVQTGGHDVPEDKILSRYVRTMALFPLALKIAERAFVYDNSGPGGISLGLTKNTTYVASSGMYKSSYSLIDGAAEWIENAFAALPSDGTLLAD